MIQALPAAPSPYTADLRARLRAALAPFAPKGQPYALLDWPAYANIGDSLLWLGALSLLCELTGLPPAYVTRSRSFPADLDRLMPEGTVFLLGGGNFGDLWPGYHENRLQILARYRHRRIVQLPQSLHYRAPEAEDAMARALAGHPDVTVMLRDRAAYDRARAQFDCPSLCLPDLAFGLAGSPALALPDPPRAAVFCLMRGDSECRAGGPGAQALAALGPVGDWADEPRARGLGRHLPGLMRALPAALRAPLMPRLEAFYHRRAAWRLGRGLAMIGQGRVLVTDRLHGHILALLVGQDHVVLDNATGKIAAFRATWPGAERGLWAEDMASLRAGLARLGVICPEQALS